MGEPIATLSVVVEADVARANRDLLSLDKNLEAARDAALDAMAAVAAFGKVDAEATVSVDATQARRALDEAARQVESFGDQSATATADLDIDPFVAEMREALGSFDEFEHERATAVLDANSERVTRQVMEASAEVREFGERHETATLDVDTSKLNAMTGEVRNAGKEVSGLSGEFEGLHKAKSDTDTLLERNVGTFGDVSTAVRDTGSAVSFSASGFSKLQLTALALGVGLLAAIGPAIALAAALAPLVGLAAAAGAGALAGAQGFGVFKLATMGVLDALKEQTTARAAAGTDALKQAGQEQAAARAISAAMEGVRSAKEGVQRATESLGEAQRTERQTIDALGPAYQQARRQLQDLDESVTQANLSLRQAKLDASDARQALAALLAGPSPAGLASAHAAVAKALSDEQVAARGLLSANQSLADSLHGEQGAVADLQDAYKSLNDLMAPPAILDVADAQDAVSDALRGQQHAANDLADQVTATNAVLNDPTSTADAKARAQLALADAQDKVGDAARATAHAQADLAKLEAGPDQDALAAARRRVSDAEYAVGAASRATADARQGIIDAEQRVTDAKDATTAAQVALTKAESPASSEALARARLALAQADDHVSEATRTAARAATDYVAAESAGVAHMPSVLAAREAVRSAVRAATDAERGLTDAQHQELLAAQALVAAQSSATSSSAAAAGAAQNLNAKLDALPAPAQAFVRQLESMQPLLTDLRTTSAGGFFPGAGEGLTAAAHSFAPVKKVVGETSSVLGDLARRAGELVGSSAFGKDIDTVGTRNAQVLDTMGGASLHVVSAIRNIIVTAGPLESWLARVADKWALNAAEATKAGRESGAMAGFFDRTRSVLERLGSIVSNVAGGLFGMGKTGTDSGNQILASIDRASQHFDAWANSVGGQNQIRKFFQETKDLAAAILPAIQNAAGAFGTLTLRLLPVTDALKLLGPYAGDAVDAFVAWKLTVTAVTIVTKAWSAATAIAEFATGGWTGAFWALNAAMDANPIGAAVLAIAALVAGVIYAYHHFQAFRDIVDAVWSFIKDHWPLLVSIVLGPIGLIAVQVIKHWDDIRSTAETAFSAVADAFGWITQAAQDMFGWIKDHWQLLLGILTGPITLAAAAIGGHVDDIVAFFTAMPGRIADAIKAGGAAFASAVGWIKDQVVNGIKSYIDLYVGLGGWLLKEVIDGIKAGASVVASVAGWLWGQIQSTVHSIKDDLTGLGSWVLSTLVDGLQAITDKGVSGVSGVGGWLWGQLQSIVHGLKDDLGDLGGWVLGTIVNGLQAVTTVGGKAVSGVSSVGTWILGQLRSLLKDIKDDFSGLGTSIIGWIVDGLKAGAIKVQDFLNDIIHVINELPDVQIGDIDVIKKAQGGVHAAGAVQGHAQGGAFARTGGFVGSPITLMGEEAPRFPEWVIPENPAYRSRALGLWEAAGQRIGAMAIGGVYTASDFGGHDDPSAYGHATASGAIANDTLWGFAELSNPPSSLNFSALGHLPMGTKIDIGYNGKTARGVPKVDVGAGGAGIGGHIRAVDMTYAVAQSLGFPGLGNVTVTGANAGVGADGNVGGSTGIGGAIGSAVGAVTGIVGDLLAKGASFLIDQLPGVDKLPDWIQGAGKYVLDHVADWIKDEVKGLVAPSSSGGSGGGPTTPGGVTGVGTFGGVPMANWVIEALNYGRAHGAHGNPTSGYRPGIDPHTASGKSEHQGTQYPHGAVDFGGFHDSAAYAEKMSYVEATRGFKHPLLAPIGFVDDGHASGTGHFMGGIYGGAAGLLGSFERGTDYVPQTGPYLLHQGESVTPAGSGDPLELQITVKGDGDLERVIAGMIDVRVKRGSRDVAATWKAGRR